MGGKIEKMKRKKNVLITLLAAFIILGAAGSVHTCVGRLLVIAVGDSADQAMMGEMLSVLINERTGTTVNILPLDGLEKCHEAVLKGKANIYINYIGMGQDAGGAEVNDPQKIYTLVRQAYQEKYGMVWLKPFGFEGPFQINSQTERINSSLAAPISTKEVLRKFPVLDRVINKLAGRIDDRTLDELVRKTTDAGVKDVVTEFLRGQKLI